jgi:DNA-binding GntR family transcriptional regulator
MEQAHAAIKDRIMTLQVLPGQRLEDIELGKELELSRTPIREALYRLSSEGLVTVTGSGFAVRSLDLLDVSQLFEAHLVVARTVGRLLARRATENGLRALHAATDEVDQAVSRRAPAEIAVRNAELHRLEASLAGNEHIKALAWSIHDQEQRLAYLSFGGQADWTDLDEHFKWVCRDHEEFFVAISDRDADTAEGVAARHVHLFRDRVQRFLVSDDAEGLTLGTELP